MSGTAGSTTSLGMARAHLERQHDELQRWSAKLQAATHGFAVAPGDDDELRRRLAECVNACFTAEWPSAAEAYRQKALEIFLVDQDAAFTALKRMAADVDCYLARANGGDDKDLFNHWLYKEVSPLVAALNDWVLASQYLYRLILERRDDGEGSADERRALRDIVAAHTELQRDAAGGRCATVLLSEDSPDTELTHECARRTLLAADGGAATKKQKTSDAGPSVPSRQRALWQEFDDATLWERA